MPELIVYGHSDDLLEVEIWEHMGESSRSLFQDEMSNNKTLNINGHFEIKSEWTNHGLLLGIVILNEDIVLKEFYNIYYDFEEAHYTPRLVIDSSIPIVIEGIFGGKETKLRNLLRSEFDDDEIDKFFKIAKDSLQLK